MPRKRSEYLEHAIECRRLATVVASAEHRQILLQMAETWESLARQRKILSDEISSRLSATPRND